MQPVIWQGMLTLPKWSPIIKITPWSCSPPSMFSSALILIQADSLWEDSANHFGLKIDFIRSSIWPHQNIVLTFWNLCFHMRKNWRVLSWLMLRCSVEIFPNPATCLIDLIPTPLLKTLHGFFEVELLNIANYFLQTSVFSACLSKGSGKAPPEE